MALSMPIGRRTFDHRRVVEYVQREMPAWVDTAARLRIPSYRMPPREPAGGLPVCFGPTRVVLLLSIGRCRNRLLQVQNPHRGAWRHSGSDRLAQLGTEKGGRSADLSKYRLPAKKSGNAATRFRNVLTTSRHMTMVGRALSSERMITTSRPSPMRK
jgi:hypothetical protein